MHCLHSLYSLHKLHFISSLRAFFSLCCHTFSPSHLFTHQSHHVLIAPFTLFACMAPSSVLHRSIGPTAFTLFTLVISVKFAPIEHSCILVTAFMYRILLTFFILTTPSPLSSLAVPSRAGIGDVMRGESQLSQLSPDSLSRMDALQADRSTFTRDAVTVLQVCCSAVFPIRNRVFVLVTKKHYSLARMLTQVPLKLLAPSHTRAHVTPRNHISFTTTRSTTARG